MIVDRRDFDIIYRWLNLYLLLRSPRFRSCDWVMVEAMLDLVT